MPEKNGCGKTVVIAATLDTKSVEIEFVRREIEARGLSVVLVDCGILGQASVTADISAERIAIAGGSSLEALRGARNRETAIPVIIAGLQAWLREMIEAQMIDGYYGIGGGTNAALAAAAFEVLPFGMPKMLVTTVASGNTRPFVGMKDVTLVHSVVDILGLNAYLRNVVRQSVAGFSGMVEAYSTRSSSSEGQAARIGLTAYGATTTAASRLEQRLTAAGAEVLTFHARGIGGLAMEAFIREGRISAVLDLTTTEVADEIVGGACSAGPLRLEAAGSAGLPQVVLPGAIDMVNFGPRSTVPERFKGRQFVSHTPNATLMRTTVEENVLIARFIARKLNAANGPVKVVLPLRGFSDYSGEGGVFWAPEADQAFIAEIRNQLNSDIPVELVDAHINTPETVEVAYASLASLGGLSGGIE